jgi:hypothetical protein
MQNLDIHFRAFVKKLSYKDTALRVRGDKIELRCKMMSFALLFSRASSFISLFFARTNTHCS